MENIIKSERLRTDWNPMKTDRNPLPIVTSEISAIGALQKPVSGAVAKHTPGPEVREAEGRSKER